VVCAVSWLIGSMEERKLQEQGVIYTIGEFSWVEGGVAVVGCTVGRQWRLWRRRPWRC
jgi:hypothetical protein